MVSATSKTLIRPIRLLCTLILFLGSLFSWDRALLAVWPVFLMFLLFIMDVCSLGSVEIPWPDELVSALSAVDWVDGGFLWLLVVYCGLSLICGF